jgi:hypothetical protein
VTPGAGFSGAAVCTAGAGALSAVCAVAAVMDSIAATAAAATILRFTPAVIPIHCISTPFDFPLWHFTLSRIDLPFLGKQARTSFLLKG